MGKHGRIALTLGLSLLGGCGKAEPTALARKPAPRTAEQPAPPVSVYDARGNLLGSEERIEWLELPLAFRPQPGGYQRHVLYAATGVSMDKVREFLATRMFTGAVEETSHSVYYRAVMPMNADPKATRLDLRIVQRPGVLELDVERLSYGDAKPLALDEAKRVLAEEQARAH